ncbi:mitochondrial 37S ribosomal protein uS4m [Lodderomyces beijingensis]|uniref:RNA-binding S4 domain-containing protein n=1 Tax=Lodderomyces beijingensis TaxID=1775926 RepID=A0ABP0ZIR8_9ASCO
MPRKLDKVSHLMRGQVGMSMNVQNLFNLYRKKPLSYHGKTLYQQKWAAKAETRAYHGDQLREKRFKKVLFEPELKTNSQLDASLKGEDVAPTPITLQTYAVLEKRLEFALFRSMFASSVRQARQFILGGYVKVNGVTIKHPSFPLQSGDVFSVDPERVLFALGRTKPNLKKAIRVDNQQIAAWNAHVKLAKANPEEFWKKQQNKLASLDDVANLKLQEREQRKESVRDKEMKKKQNETTKNTVLKDIVLLGNAAAAAAADATASGVSVHTFEKYGKNADSKCLQVYQMLLENKSPLLEDASDAAIDKFFAKDVERTPDETRSVRKVISILKELEKSEWDRIRGAQDEFVDKFYHPSLIEKLTPKPLLDAEKILEDPSTAKVDLQWQKGLFGRKDPSKSYFTPWTPRPFLGAFAILPSHIEVSFDTCHAVYLRDPVARPGHSEVISPFPDHVHERAYMYYIKKGA